MLSLNPIKEVKSLTLSDSASTFMCWVLFSSPGFTGLELVRVSIDWMSIWLFVFL